MRSVALALPLALLVLVSCGGEPVIAEPQYIDPALLPELRQAASEACLCARDAAAEARQACWAQFRDEVARFRHTETASACGSASTAFISFEPRPRASGEQDPDWEFDDAMIVMTERGYGACSDAEYAQRRTEFEQQGDSSC